MERLKMKLYGISNRFDNYKITEFEIVKETELTFIIINNNDKLFHSKYTIRKKDMSNNNYVFTLTYKEALEMRKSFLRREIKNNIQRIENLEDRNVELGKILDILEY